MKKIFSAIAGLAITASMFVMAGCNKEASLISIAGVAISSLETVEGNTALAATISKDFSAFALQVKNFTPGGATADLQQAAADVTADLNLIPVSQKDANLIDLAISTVLDVVAEFVPTSTPSVSAHVAYPVQVVPAKSAAEFKARWNAIAAKSVPAAKLK